MGRGILGLIAGGALGAIAGNAALMQFFGKSFNEIWERTDERTLIFAAVIGLPLLFLFVRGWIGSLVAAMLLSGVAAAAAKLYFETDMSWQEVLTMTTVYGLVAVVIYRTLVSRVLG